MKGSVGQGKLAAVPWIMVSNPNITKKAFEGEYIVYLLNKDTKELFLTFNQASTESV